jgi:RNA polymerase sigma-70 factor (ECF subfamily)
MTKSSPTEANRATGTLEERYSPTVAGAAEGDPDALSHLLESARPVVYRWAAARVKNHDDAEDVTQLVLLRLYANLTSFRGESRLSSWLYRVTVNEAAGYHRRESRYRDVIFMWTESESLSFGEKPKPDRIDDQRTVTAVREAASKLPPHQKSAFSLVDLHGLRPCEAARRLGKTQSAIRSNLCRARQKIRDLVAECRQAGNDDQESAA